MNEDTEIKVALVTSLLERNIPDAPTTILSTLIDCDGDVALAAERLNAKKSGSSASGKRRRSGGLTDWVKPTSKGKVPRLDSKPQSRIESSISSSSTSKPLSKSTDTKPRSKSAHPLAQPKDIETKPTVDLMSVLRQEPVSPKKKSSTRLPPLTLSNPDMVAEHTPCTLHYSVLPPELACRLFYAMVDRAQGWKRNKWWLFDKVVESPHRMSFFVRSKDGEGSAWHQPYQDVWHSVDRNVEPTAEYPPEMEEACQYIERLVNDTISKRERFPLEYAGNGKEGSLVWRPNVAASNCYAGGKDSVGFHSDQMTYLGPYCTIASLSLGTRRVFSLREVVPVDEKETRHARTYNIPLSHNSLTIMHGSCQERFKHSIPPQNSIDIFYPPYPRSPGEAIESSNCRINITFRFYRPDFLPSSIPQCKCGTATALRADMKNRNVNGDRYWWCCIGGSRTPDGKGCNFWRVMDMKAEGRGPCIGPM